MNNVRTLFAGALCALMTAGCIESRVTLNINGDGTGTLESEEFMSPQVTGMMEQFGQAVGGGEEGKKAASGPLAMFAEQIEKKSAQFGGSARLVKKEAKTNAAGWKGYQLVYKFDNVEQLFLPIGGGDQDGEKQPDRYRIEFAKGNPNVLRLIPPGAPKADAAPAPAPDPGAAQEAGMEAQMAAMMASMLQGMRMTMDVRVDGRIVKGDGVRVAADGKSAAVFDIAMDKMVGNADAMAAMTDQSSSENEKMRRLAALKIDGVTVPDAAGPIVIEFK